MKFPIAATLIILVIGGAMGLMHEKRLTTLREDQRQLAAKAEKLGIHANTNATPEDSRVTKRQRDDRADEAQAMTADFIAFAREIERHDEAGNPEDEAFEKRGLEIQARLMGLDPGQLRIVIAGLREDKTLAEDTRQNLICYSIAMLSEDHPAAALALFTESADLLDDSMLGAGVISSTLGSWAKEDPLAALEWVRRNEAAHPDLADDDAKRSIIAGAAANDPALAFKLMAEMRLDDTSSAIQALSESGRTPEQRTAILGALRKHLETLPAGEERDDLLSESLETMGRNLSNENFDAAQAWISRSQLSPEESARFVAGLSYFNTKEDTGRWIDWMAGNLPKEEVAENVDNLIGQWTQQDYLAAGRWLSAAPEGPAKQAAVSTYAETVAEYEPQTAVLWALTLPAGQARTDTLEAIYQNWPESDAEAAAAFAKEHGVDTGGDDDDSDEATEEP